jgi:allophanate hydrolase
MMSAPSIPLDLPSLRAAYLSRSLSPSTVVYSLLVKAQQLHSPHNLYTIWTHLLSAAELEPYLQALADKDPATLPLYGIPFAIKDNIDLASIPTTAACPAFAYTPTRSAKIVELLIQAGAIPLGKTNMDQFATGLVGTRSPAPWGPCRNALNPDYISGGSSSGSAVAVALGLVSFALGTDTAGSGRVPAMLNNIYGLKPSRGLLSMRGVLPACRSLDCPSLFALSANDLQQLFTVTAQADVEDVYSRSNPYANSARKWGLPKRKPRIAVPTAANLQFFGQHDAAQRFAAAVEQWREFDATLIECDIAPLLAAAQLLYAGPWVAERYAAIAAFIEQQPEQIHPVVRTIIEGARSKTAIDAFVAEYQMQAYRQAAQRLLADVDFLLTPTAPGVWSIAELLNDPVTLNSQMGYYTNYLNLLDLCGIAVPAGLLDCGVGFGVTMIAPALREQVLLGYAHQWQLLRNNVVGAGISVTLPAVNANDPSSLVSVAVCGAHLSGMPLNWQLRERGAQLLYAGKTSKHYRLYALAGAGIARPGLVRDAQHGAHIDIEVWSLTRGEFGDFVANIPAPLGIGKLETEHGEWVCGFICEPCGIAGATEITQQGGWRQYMQSRN